MIKKTIIITLAITLAFTTCFAQLANKVKLDSLFTCLDINKKAMGTVAISKNGQLLYTKSIGYSLYNKKEKIPATGKTIYRIGSISKMFTAAIIFQLIEEGKITLTTPLGDYFSQIPNSQTITISHLLNHKSGIPNIIKIRSKKRARTHEEMMALISSKKFSFLPGAKTLYSNSNYLLLGYIIEKILNKPYADVLNERIISKAGLNNTCFGNEPGIENNKCFAYKFKRRWRKQSATDLSIPGASGGIVSTPSDMTRFIEALVSNKLVSPNSLDKMKPISDQYGMGLLPFELGTKKAYGHTGGIDHFASVVAYFPEDSLAVAYCSNGRVYPVKDIVIGALNIYFNREYVIPDFTLTGKKPKHLQKCTGIYASTEIPFRIIISKNKKKLVAQPAGYPSYELEAATSNKFINAAAAVVLEFNPGKNEMKLMWGGLSYHFNKENKSE